MSIIGKISYSITKMLKSSCIILPDPQQKNEICDFIEQTANELSKNHQVIILKLADPVSLTELFFKLFQNGRSESTDGKDQSRVIRPLFFLPFTRFQFVTNANYVLFNLIFQSYLLLLNLVKSKRTIFWFFFPETYRLVFPQFWVHFDCVDIHPENATLPKTGGKTDKLISRANTITAIAKSQKKLLQTLTNKKIQLVPQGFIIPKFNRVITTRGFRNTINPVIGFTGVLSDRIDYDLLLELAIKNPQWRFELWGPMQFFYTEPQLTEAKINKIKKLKNVFLFGKIPRIKLYKKMMKFDIGIIPYKIDNILNQYCYPMKLLEYFYCGIPVVATPINELKKYFPMVKIASSSKEWELAIKSILTKPWLKVDQYEQLSISINNTWQLKVNMILSLIHKRMI